MVETLKYGMDIFVSQFLQSTSLLTYLNPKNPNAIKTMTMTVRFISDLRPATVK